MTIYSDDSLRPILQIAMPRVPRIYAPGETVHVVARCNNREFYFTAQEYNLAGRLIKETNSLSQFKTYAYDAAGNRTSRIDEDSMTIQYAYDDVNRLTQITYPNSTTATFGYDVRSNLTSAANVNIGYALSYDLSNRLTRVLDSNNKTVSYQYNGLNQRTQMVTPDGRTITYAYNTTNRLSQISSAIGAFNISYDDAGRKTSLDYPNLVTTTYSYNAASFLTNLVARYNQQTTINSFAYTPDGMSNRATMTDLAGPHAYTYDNTYQLTQATHPNMPLEHFSYDQVGNRLTSEGQAPSVGRDTEYVHDFENRLIEVNYFGMAVQYNYDPFGRRIEKNLNNGATITRYVYDGPNTVTQYDGAWNVTAKYTHTLDIDDPLTVQQGANTYYYHRDGLGSVVNLTDSAGSNIKSYTYKTFGEIYSESGTLVQPFTFTGREYDPESGLYYYRARHYDPRAGKFLTKDPIGFAGGDVNLYRYVRNNPVNLIDPSGLQACCAQDFLMCLSNCIQAYDPFNAYAKAGLYAAGGPIPKNWFGLPTMGGSPYTSLPSVWGLGRGTAASGSNLLRIIGRGSSVGFLIYGNYLFGIEIMCAAQCSRNNCAY